MTAAMSDLGRDLYDLLTSRTFLVVDTEFSTHDGDHHLVSLAVVAIVAGRRTKAADELYRVVNPGVAIDETTSAIHGFTDADVARKPTFDKVANVLLARLSEHDAVFVCHNPIDAHVLLAEFARLDRRAQAGDAGITVGVADLPDLPILDTQRLAYAVGYPGITKNMRLSLDRLCDLTGVARTGRAHHARATADALIELLRYTAEHCRFWNVEDLLDAASGGTLHAPEGPAHIRGKRKRPSELPAEHIAKHTNPLVDAVPPGGEEAEAWLDTAAECAGLRCPWLRDEATVAGPANGHHLLDALMNDLPHLTEPGQAGTLLGAVTELLAAKPTDPARPTLAVHSALRWWARVRPVIAASVPCDRASAATCCPACQNGEPCPRDVVYLPLAETVTVGTHGQMSKTRARDLLQTRRWKGQFNTWRTGHPEILAYALWRTATFLFSDADDERAYTAVDNGIALGIHTTEPRLAVLACQRVVENGDATAAFAAADAALADRTTDAAYDELADWVLFTDTALYAQQPPSRRSITHPRRARPEGHVNPRLYI